MSDTATAINLGTTGVHYVEGELTPEAAAEVERLGYPALWIAGTREVRLTTVERVLAATETLVVATGVVNVWHMDARAVADTYHWLETAYPGRFLLGIGAGHRDPAHIPAESRLEGVRYRGLDLTDIYAIEGFVTAIGAEGIHVDVVVNNAGESQSGPLEDLPIGALERLFRLNVLGPVHLTQLLLPGMRHRGYGRVVMVGLDARQLPARLPVVVRRQQGRAQGLRHGGALRDGAASASG